MITSSSILGEKDGGGIITKSISGEGEGSFLITSSSILDEKDGEQKIEVWCRLLERTRGPWG